MRLSPYSHYRIGTTLQHHILTVDISYYDTHNYLGTAYENTSMTTISTNSKTKYVETINNFTRWV